MNIARADIVPYSLPLVRSLPPSAGGGRERHGWLLRVTTTAGATEYGEAAPLAGPSPETPQAAHDSLEFLIDALPRMNPWPESPLDVLNRVGCRSDVALTPSVRFAAETAVLNAWSVERGVSWHRALGRPCQPRVRVNALAAGSEDEVLEDVRQAVREGFRCVKVKVGSQSVDDAVRTVRHIRTEFAGRLALRLDANRLWTITEALAFAAGVRDCNVEYLEEPLRDDADLPGFRRESGLRVAVEQGPLTAADSAGDARHEADAWIIKPTRCGGIAAALSLAEQAQRAGIVPVISSAFESGVGLRALFLLAATIHDAGTAAGLGTGSWFARDTLAKPLIVSGGDLHVESSLAVCTPIAEAYRG